MSKAVATVHIDNEHVRVTEWAFEPGAATGWHWHDFDYVIIPVIGGVVEIEDGAGKRTPFEMVAGVSYFRKAGVAHDVINGPGASSGSSRSNSSTGRVSPRRGASTPAKALRQNRPSRPRPRSLPRAAAAPGKSRRARSP